MAEAITGKTRLVENFFSLSALQAATYLLPLVTVPYLVRVLGPEKFGLLAFAQAFTQYFTTFTDYGFNLSATRKMSIYRNDADRASRIFSSVLFIKLSFLLIGFVIFSGAVLAIPKFREYWLVYLFTFGMTVGSALFPVWFFQGVERMKYLTYLGIIPKAVFTIAIFIFIRKEADFIFVPFINSCGAVIAGAMGLLVAWRKFRIKVRLPSIGAIMEELRDGWYVFMSTMAISLYTTSNTFILGLFTNNTIVGYYSAAEKIVNMVQGLFMPISQSTYPYISKLASDSKEKALIFMKKIGFILGVVTFVASLSIFVFAPLIVRMVLGSQYRQSVIVLRILAFVPFIVGIATIYAKFYLLGFGYLKELSRVIIGCGVASLVFAFIYIHLLSLNASGAALTWFSTECCVLIFSYAAYRKLAYAHR